MDQDIDGIELCRINSLPRDIIIDILSRLPITNFMQISLVSRSWRDKSRDPSLFAEHLSHLKRNNPCLVLQSLPRLNEICVVGFSCPNKDNVMVKKFCPLVSKFQLVASCDGLVCLFQSDTDAISICNPFTRTCFDVPRSPLSIRDVLGFGSNSILKEHKILAYVSTLDKKTRHPRDKPWSSFHRFYILTIGGSSWRELEHECYNFVRPSMQVLVNNSLHWTTSPSRDRRTYWTRYLTVGHGLQYQSVGHETYSIVSFDLADEQFREVGRPDCGGLDNIRYQLVELRGCLSAAAECNDGRMKIWVMKNYGVKESWINEYVIGTYLPNQPQHGNDSAYRNIKYFSSSGSLAKVLCLQRDNEILFQYNCRGLVSYNPETGTFTEHKPARMPAVFDAIVYGG